MKTLTLTNVKKNLGLVTMALVAVLAMTGCGSKKSNNNINNGYGAFPPGCTTNCVGGSPLFSALGSSGYEDIALHIVGQNNGSASYYGPVQAHGTISIRQPMSLCQTYPGQVAQLTTVQGGQWQGQSLVSPMVLQGNGITLVIEQAYVNAAPAQIGVDGYSYGYRLVVTRGYINSQACSLRTN